MKRLRPLGARDLWNASRGFTLVWVAHLGRRHGLLRALAAARGGLTPGGVAARARRDAHAVRLWCEAAAALGLLQAQGGRYRLPRRLVPLLVDERDPAYLGGHLDYLALRSLDFDAFDELFRDGARSARRQRHLVEAFSEATKWDHTAFLSAFLPRAPDVAKLLRRGADVLDVGAGAGAWGLRVAEAFPRSRVVGLEPNATALRLARAAASRAGLDARVTFVRGSAQEMPFEERFDLVYLGEALCVADDVPEILRRCRRALRARGVLVVAEGLVDEGLGADDPENALVKAMRLEFALQPAVLFSKGALRAVMASAGLCRIRVLPASGGFYFVRADKGPRGGH